jgi:hypothetical protein
MNNFNGEQKVLFVPAETCGRQQRSLAVFAPRWVAGVSGGRGELHGDVPQPGCVSELQVGAKMDTLGSVSRRKRREGMARWAKGEQAVQFLVDRNRLESFEAEISLR